MSDQKQNDEVNVVIEVMIANTHSLNIQKAASYIIRRLSFYPAKSNAEYRVEIEANRKQFGRLDAVNYLLRAMNCFKDCPELLSGALCALGNLAIYQLNSDELVRLGGLNIILDSMRRFIDTFPVIDYGSFVICNVADDPKYKEHVRKEKGLEFAIENIKKETTPKEHLGPFLDLIAVLTQDSEERKLLGNDILTHLCVLIIKYKSDSQLLTHCLAVVMVLCENSENRTHGISLGMIPLLFEVLSLHEKAPVVVMKASLALFTLFWRDTDPEMDANRRKLVDIIINALKVHPDEISLQRTSAAMLSDFAHDDPTLKRYIISLGGIALVKRAALLGVDDVELDEGWDLLVELITLDY